MGGGWGRGGGGGRAGMEWGGGEGREEGVTADGGKD